MPETLQEARDQLADLDLGRLALWLIAGIALYWLSIHLGSVVAASGTPAYPQAQVIAQKLANATVFAWLGYWLARGALGRIDNASHPMQYVARGILIAGIVLAGATGL
jgi:hypothetical protein